MHERLADKERRINTGPRGAPAGKEGGSRSDIESSRSGWYRLLCFPCAAKANHFGKLMTQDQIWGEIQTNAARSPARKDSNGSMTSPCVLPGQDIRYVTSVDPNIEACCVQAAFERHGGNSMGKRVGGLPNVFYAPKSSGLIGPPIGKLRKTRRNRKFSWWRRAPHVKWRIGMSHPQSGSCWLMAEDAGPPWIFVQGGACLLLGSGIDPGKEAHCLCRTRFD